MDQVEERLIEEIKKHEHLYNSSSSHYKDCQMAQNSWREISRSIGLDMYRCIKKWKNLRDKYVRHRKKMASQSGNPGVQRVPAFCRFLSWLAPYVKHREKESNYDAKDLFKCYNRCKALLQTSVRAGRSLPPDPASTSPARTVMGRALVIPVCPLVGTKVDGLSIQPITKCDACSNGRTKDSTNYTERTQSPSLVQDFKPHPVSSGEPSSSSSEPSTSGSQPSTEPPQSSQEPSPCSQKTRVPRLAQKRKQRDEDEWILKRMAELSERRLELHQRMAQETVDECSRFGQTAADLLRRLPDEKRPDVMLKVFQVMHDSLKQQ